MKYKHRLKRVADILANLGVASLAVGLFQNSQTGLWLGMGCLVASIVMTREDA